MRQTDNTNIDSYYAAKSWSCQTAYYKRGSSWASALSVSAAACKVYSVGVLLKLMTSSILILDLPRGNSPQLEPGWCQEAFWGWGGLQGWAGGAEEGCGSGSAGTTSDQQTSKTLHLLLRRLTADYLRTNEQLEQPPCWSGKGLSWHARAHLNSLPLLVHTKKPLVTIHHDWLQDEVM